MLLTRNIVVRQRGIESVIKSKERRLNDIYRLFVIPVEYRSYLNNDEVLKVKSKVIHSIKSSVKNCEAQIKLYNDFINWLDNDIDREVIKSVSDGVPLQVISDKYFYSPSTLNHKIARMIERYNKHLNETN